MISNYNADDIFPPKKTLQPTPSLANIYPQQPTVSGFNFYRKDNGNLYRTRIPQKNN
jgi:hypothetical protein